MKVIFSCILLFFCALIYSQSTDTLKVHFLYGSRPANGFKHVERKWFGGKLGGHVGVEFYPNQIVHFVPSGKFKIFRNKSGNFHSRFLRSDIKTFYQIFGAVKDSSKYAVYAIPITTAQRKSIDSVCRRYLDSVPYDYAFFGMRCAAAAYDLMSITNVVQPLAVSKCYKKYFYPRKLRKALAKMAAQNHWQVFLHTGTKRRIWDK